MFYVFCSHAVCPSEVTIYSPDGIVNGTTGLLSCYGSSANPPLSIGWAKYSGHGYVPINSTHETEYEDAEYNGQTATQNFTTDVLFVGTIIRYRCIISSSRCSTYYRYYYPNIFCKYQQVFPLVLPNKS